MRRETETRRRTQATRRQAVIGTALLALVFGISSWAQTVSDWATYQSNVQRQSVNMDPNDPLTPDNASALGIIWTYATGGIIGAQPAVVNGVVYVGSWDGWLYALDAYTGAFYWRTFLGVTPLQNNCDPPQAGIHSTVAAYTDTTTGLLTLIVGGVDNDGGPTGAGSRESYLFSVDAGSGVINWRRSLGKVGNEAGQGWYNWDSAAIANNRIYYGTASFGDCPLVPGQLYALNLNDGADVVAPHDFVNQAAGEVGGGIWTSPAIDPDTGTIYLTTGTPGFRDYRRQPQVNAVVALDWNTLQVKASWQYPGPLEGDFDFGTTPIIFSTGASDPGIPAKLVGATNKNGVFYAFDIDDPRNLSGGPVWTQRVAESGECPQCGDGSVSSPAFVNGTLYLPGGHRYLYRNGTRVVLEGNVAALDPATGRVKWRRSTRGPVIGPISGSVNGLLFVPSAKNLNPPQSVNDFEVMDARDGTTLYKFSAGNRLWSGASLSNGVIYVGSYDKNLYALSLVGDPVPPAANTPPSGLDAAPSDGTVLLSWMSRGAATSFNVERTTTPDNPASWTVIATGVTDVSYADSSLTNGTIYYYRVRGVLDGGAITDPTATRPCIPTRGISNWLSKDVDTELAGSADVLPDGAWKISGSGRDIFDKYDGFRYVYKPMGDTDFEIVARLRSQTVTSQYTKSGVDVRSASFTQGVDGGGIHLGIYWLASTGVEINYRTDFYADSRFEGHIAVPLPVWLKVQRVGQYMTAFYSTNGTSWIQVGPKVDFGDRIRPGGVLAGLATTAHDDFQISQSIFDNVRVGLTVPARAPQTVTGLGQNNAVALSWPAMPRATGYHVYRANTPGGAYTRLTSSPLLNTNYTDTGRTNHTAYFYKISSLSALGENLSSEFRFRAGPTTLDGWTAVDINTIVFGDTDVNTGPASHPMLIWSEGVDLYGNNDSFHFVYKPLNGNGEIQAGILPFDSTDFAAKGGVMIRESTQPNSKYFGLFYTGSGSICVQYRPRTVQQTTVGACAPAAVGNRIRVVRTGNTFQAYRGTNGFDFVPFGAAVTIPMNTGAFAGIGVASHSLGVPTTARFEWNFVF